MAQKSKKFQKIEREIERDSHDGYEERDMFWSIDFLWPTI